MSKVLQYAAVAAVVGPLLSAAPVLAQPADAAPPAAPPAEPATADDGTGEPDPARPPPKGRGAVWGVVTDAASKEALFEAPVTVVGTKYKTIADLDGRFRLELPPGTYELRVWYELHKARRIQNVVVTAGKTARVDAALEPDKGAEEVVEVEAAPDRANAATQLVIRKNAAAVGDAVSAQEIAKSPDRNAADAAKRVVGATVVGGKYVFVRGLGERYANALLNGAPLPSPEPDRQAIPLDMFPALVLSDITIVKTFTPDVPGDFAGGSVRVSTREIPDKFMFQASLSAGLNTESTFAERLTYQGSSLDWLGIDGGTRALPKEIPDYKVVRLGPKPDGTTITADELEAYGEKMNAYMSTRRTINLPNLSGSLVVGDVFKLKAGAELGYTAALNYGRKFTRRVNGIIADYRPDSTDPGSLVKVNDYAFEQGMDQVSWGGYSSVGAKLGKNHALRLIGLHSRSSDNNAREVEGVNEERGTNLRDTKLSFVSRSLTFGQLAGEHALASLGDAVLAWNTSLSLATSDEPDTRQTVYTRDGTTGVYSWDKGTLSGSHVFGAQRETGYGGGVDWTQPLIKGDSPTKLKLGALLGKKRRTFDARRFRFTPKASAKPDVFESQPDELFTRENIGPALVLEEYTRANDAYTANHDIYAGYMMADAALTPRLRVIVGARIEASTQTIDSFDPYAAELAHTRAELSTTDLLPSASVVLKTTKASNLRLSATRTVARPQLRELSPFAFTEYFGGFEIEGNPMLQRTSIYNADLRFELFPSLGEVMALSVFYKHFVDPIETVIKAGSNTITYENSKAAENAGVELELRKGLGFIAPAAKDLSVLANLTLVSSRVELDPATVFDPERGTRPLAGQSPYVVNAGLDYANESTGTRARVLYNLFGERIERVGKEGMPDIYEQPRHQLDATVAQRLGKHVDLKLTAENILDAAARFTQRSTTAPDGEVVVSEYHTGATVTLSATYIY